MPQASSAFYSHLYISPVSQLGPGETRSGLKELFSTHPATEKRVAAIRRAKRTLAPPKGARRALPQPLDSESDGE